jgi:D-3-phosphoglycerate dehydrogenase
VYDPYIKPKVLEELDLEPVSLDELLKRSDYITIHTPKTKETAGLINRETISKMKEGAMLINCARGGIVNEDDLYEALKSGRLAGAALDVFETEPPGKIELMELDNFICTPHLGASTGEAQDNVAKDVAEQIVAYLLHGTVKNAVNVPSISAELMTVLRPYVMLAEKMGLVQAQLTESGIEEVHINYAGKVTEYDLTPLTTAVTKGLLTPIVKDDVNFINASIVAAERGIKVVESKTATSENFASLIVVRVKTVEGENIVSGTIFEGNFPRILRINDFYLEAVPEGHNLLIHNEDTPGVIGRICTCLGNSGVNIARMHVGQNQAKKQNAMLLAAGSQVGAQVLKELSGLKGVLSVRPIEL